MTALLGISSSNIREEIIMEEIPNLIQISNAPTRTQRACKTKCRPIDKMSTAKSGQHANLKCPFS